MATKPSFLGMWGKYSEINKSVQEVGRIIGGKVGSNIQNNINFSQHDFWYS